MTGRKFSRKIWRILRVILSLKKINLFDLHKIQSLRIKHFK